MKYLQYHLKYSYERISSTLAQFLIKAIIYLTIAYLLLIPLAYLLDNTKILTDIKSDTLETIDIMIAFIFLLAVAVIILKIIPSYISTKERAFLSLRILGYSIFFYCLSSIVHSGGDFDNINAWMLLFMVIFVLREFKNFIALAWNKFSDSVKESNEKLPILITFFGTLISLIALFK
ncbi:hypothetical protein BMT55_08250 [Listeria newyorkensis]|uniref:Uncharacterized protein n=1 Tax=Listeria newyorkensis TaxID=1497681 RepID=A0ABX4XMI7_9LIST|nr:hypothetical protein [Listeria newyorkensis]PNP92550.1 hypothetical protein BMT55_08250 [Listeria newyorkensis]